MGDKTISLSEDVYDKLRDERGEEEEESFGDVIDRLLGRRPLADFYGAWDPDTVASARSAIDAGRVRSEVSLTDLESSDR